MSPSQSPDRTTHRRTYETVWRTSLGTGVALVTTGLVGQLVVGEGGWVDITAQSGAVLVAIGAAVAIVTRTSCVYAHRNGMALGAFAVVALVVANGAVGIVGSEDLGINAVYPFVAAVPLALGVASRFRSKWMARAMGWAGFSLLLAGIVALAHGYDGAFEVIAVHTAFAALFLGSQELFRHAARHEV